MTALLAATICCGAALAAPAYPETKAGADRNTAPGALASRYQEAANRIIDAALKDNDAFDKLEELCLTVGHRLSGSPQLDRAIEWAVARLTRDRQDHVHTERVMVPRWVRGKESATMLKPREVELFMMGLGGSVCTPAGGVTAEVEVVSNEEELEALGERARGKIVLFNNPMPDYDPITGSGYGTTVRFRHHGARLASEKGAVACLVRSVTARSLRSPHTGGMSYGEAKVRIPAAAISTEDANAIAGLRKRGITVVVNLKMEARTLPDVPSANVIAELRGSEIPEEIVVIGGHLDSWDVGQGAHDDGGGCVTAMEAINVLRRLDMIPRRTIRVVLWTNEENGLRGGKAYARDHAGELDDHVAAIESDSGIFKPTGYSIECKDDPRRGLAVQQMRDIVTLLKPIGATRVNEGHAGADVSPMKPAGVILLGQNVEGSRYFDYHHTHADTIDKVDPHDLSENVAALATVAYIIADMPQRLGREHAVANPPASTD